MVAYNCMLKDYLPCSDFYVSFFKKLLSLLISVKMFLINASILLLWKGKLTSESFEHIIIAVAAAKVGTDMVSIYHRKKKKEDLSE